MSGVDAPKRIAQLVVSGFDERYGRFREIAQHARDRFDSADWPAIQAAVQERLRVGDEQMEQTVAHVVAELGPACLDPDVWRRAKLETTVLLVGHKQPELAETFFNSVARRALGRPAVGDDYMFVQATISTEYIAAEPPTYRSYYPEGRLEPTFVRILEDFEWSRPFADLGRDAERVVGTLAPHVGAPQPNLQVRALGSAFYRNKAAYVVGKIVNGDDELPFAIAVVHDADGRLALDAALFESASIDVLFSLSRAYFMVDMDVPSAYVDFLRTIMPTKPRSELYSALGLPRHGKTLFFRDLHHHLDHSQDQFVEAPGARGQVMHVFTLPSYPYVYKLIRDRFGPTKNTTREEVVGKFRIVKEVDRVGRMVDAFEFVDLALPLARFSPALLQQLERITPSAIEVDGETLIVKQCYVERRMRPLDLHLQTAGPSEVERVVREYGDTLRELAIANIFPGDLLWRNFGLTRHGRVVCYDYDELEYLTDCVFRSIPPAPDPETELADETWFAVGTHDVFPEEFETFLLGGGAIREAFLRHQPELLRPEFWQECQRRIAAGEVVDFYPYPDEIRFASRFDGERSAA